MRPLNSEEWLRWNENTDSVVNCNYIDCAAGMGLAGNGCCFLAGEWDNPDCPQYIKEEDFEEQMKENMKEPNFLIVAIIAGLIATVTIVVWICL
jgi:hypothetical protein